MFDRDVIYLLLVQGVPVVCGKLGPEKCHVEQICVKEGVSAHQK